VIPRANVTHLMLRADVVAAADAGRFHIYAIDTVDEGLALLTGMEAGERDADGEYPRDSLNQRVETRLLEMARIARPRESDKGDA
jgi:predicted ATP-dependent protease